MTLRRMKTYTAETGYVYQYYFVGKRAAAGGDGEGPAEEFIFDASADRKTTFAVSVLLPQVALKEWATAHGRPLSDSEQYAAAKLCLLRGFDQIPDMLQRGRRLRLDPALLEELLAPLDL